MTEKEILEAKLIAEFLKINICFGIWGSQKELCSIYGKEDDMDYDEIVFFNPKTDWSILHRVIKKVDKYMHANWTICDDIEHDYYDYLFCVYTNIDIADSIKTYYKKLVLCIKIINKWEKRKKKLSLKS